MVFLLLRSQTKSTAGFYCSFSLISLLGDRGFLAFGRGLRSFREISQQSPLQLLAPSVSATKICSVAALIH